MQEVLDAAGAAGMTGPQVAAGLLLTGVITAGLAADFLLLQSLRVRPVDWRARAAALRDRPWTGAEALLLLLFVATVNVALVFAGGLARTAFPAWDHRIVIGGLVLQTLAFHLAAVLLVVQRMRAEGHSAASSLGLRASTWRRDAGLGLLFYFAAMPPVAAAAWAGHALLRALHFPIQPQSAVTLFTEPGWPLWLQVYLGLWAVVAAPLAEEALFRGVAMPAAMKETGPLAAIAVVSAFFAAIHFHAPSFLPLTTIAFGFSLAYVYTGSLLTPIVMHACFNSVSIVAVLLQRT